MQITTLSELTIDGKLSLGPGTSSKDLFDFYGDELRAWFHAQRAANDAIMVGAGTVRADDPELTVRYAPGPSPLRVVPSSDGDLPLDARIFNDGRPTLVAVPREAPAAAVAALEAKPAVQVIRCGDRHVELRELMDVLQDRGVNSLIAEGGSRLLHSLFAADLVGRIIIKHIPIIAGSAEAPTYLRAGEGAPPLCLSRWRLADLFAKSGVAVSIYEPLA
jgi:riboflavin-specific deaminase-like protein